MVSIFLESPISYLYAYDEDDNLVAGDGDIFDYLDDGVDVLSKVFDKMNITIDDPRFFKLTRRYIGKDPM